MAGATLELESIAVTDALARAIGLLGDPARIHGDMGEYLVQAHMLRFAQEVSPDGTPWAPLSPRYKKSKKKNQDRILYLDGYLAGTMRYQSDGDDLLFGSDRRYAALMHFGGELSRARARKDGEVTNYTAYYPARPHVGTSDQDNMELLMITIRHWDRAIAG